MPTFVRGLPLGRLYFERIVAPIVEEVLPGIPYAAALIGDGSEVQGFDDVRSTDHDWGPRVQLFFEPGNLELATTVLSGALAARLPAVYEGHSTHFHRGDVGEATGPWRWGEIIRGVEIHEPGNWAKAYLGVDPRPVPARDGWLAMPWSLLRGATGGEVWRDDAGSLEAIRGPLRWYPDDLWRYVIACQWQRINQEEPFVGRAAEVGAEVGSRIVAARQIRDVMHLCFLLERQYPPYTKWLETAFARLDCGPALLPLMLAALAAPSIDLREKHLTKLYESVAALHNDTGISEPVDPQIQRFHDRPFAVLNSYRFVEATRAAIGDQELRDLALHGCISQCMDSTDILSSGEASRRFGGVLGNRAP
jgi:hypothetical protein